MRSADPASRRAAAYAARASANRVSGRSTPACATACAISSAVAPRSVAASEVTYRRVDNVLHAARDAGDVLVAQHAEHRQRAAGDGLLSERLRQPLARPRDCAPCVEHAQRQARQHLEAAGTAAASRPWRMCAWLTGNVSDSVSSAMIAPAALSS